MESSRSNMLRFMYRAQCKHNTNSKKGGAGGITDSSQRSAKYYPRGCLFSAKYVVIAVFAVGLRWQNLLFCLGYAERNSTIQFY